MKRENTYFENKDFKFNIFYQDKTAPDTKLIGLHFHDYYEMIFLRSGRGEFVINGKKIDAKAGDILLVDRKYLHTAKAVESVSFYAIVFDEQLISRVASLANLQHNRMPDIIPQNQKCYKMLLNLIEKMILEFYEKKVGYDVVIVQSIERILVELRRHDLLIPDDYLAGDPFRTLVKYIDDNDKMALSLEEASDFLGYSKYHFSRQFKKFTGVNFSVYMKEVRLRKARYMLMYTCFTISEIALGCGYQNINYFDTIFKKSEKCTPRDFRKQHRV